MRLFIINHHGVQGVAHFPDDAKEFAERMTNPGGDKEVYWHPDTAELFLDGTPSGWKIMVPVAEKEEVPA